MRARNLLKIFFTIIVVPLSSLGSSAYQNQDQSPAKTKEQAIELALRYSGFNDKMIPAGISTEDVQLVVLNDTITPFLGNFTDGKSVWAILCKDVRFDPWNKIEDKVSTLRDFRIYIDSLNGHLLKIVCNHDELDSYEDPEISAQYAEEQISRAGEMYMRIPDSIPAVSFTSAAFACTHNPLASKQILGQYVLYSQKYRDVKQDLKETVPIPVWIITLRGIPPLDHHGPRGAWIPIYQRNRIRQIVNTITGRIRSTSTTPNVPLTPEDREPLFPNNLKQQE